MSKALCVRVVLLAALLVSSISCSRIGLMYKYSDWWLVRQADKYFDLDRKQKQQVEKHLKTYMQWHRREKLPEYVVFLQKQAIAVTQSDLTLEQLEASEVELQDLIRSTVEPLMQPLSGMLAGLEDKQAKHFAKRMREREEDRKERQQAKEELERWHKQAKFWLGSVNDSQKQMISRHVKAASKVRQNWWQQRGQLRKGWVNSVESSSITGLNQAMSALVMPWQAIEGNAYGQAYNDYRVIQKKFIYRMLITMEPRQRQHLKDRLHSWAEELSKLTPTASLQTADDKAGSAALTPSMIN